MTKTSLPNIHSHLSEFVKLIVRGYTNFTTSRIRTSTEYRQRRETPGGLEIGQALLKCLKFTNNKPNKPKEKVSLI